MKSHLISLVGSLAAALLVGGSLVGCAEDDYDRSVAYPQAPQPIGYTNPPSQPPVQVADVQAAPPPVAPPAPQVAPEPVISEAAQPVTPAPGEDYADTDPAALTDFRSALDPYGSWVDDPTYGTIWVPSRTVVGSDFAPYQTAGHWVYDDEYTWVSDYDWGWAPFHYGRWAYVDSYGWGWIPGRVYAGAWVSWRYGYGDWGYVGWAPLGPTWGWRGGVAFGLGFVPAEPYGYCATGELFSPRPRMVASGQAGMVGAHTRPYVPANPGVNGRVAATPRVGGPPPQVMGIPASAVAHGALSNRGVVQARAFASAGSATALGAREPVASRLGGYNASVGRAPTPYVPGGYRSPGVSGLSHFGGKLGSGFSGSALNVRPGYSPYAPPSRAFSGGYSGPSPYRGAVGGYSPYRGGASAGFSPYRGGGMTMGPGVVTPGTGSSGKKGVSHGTVEDVPAPRGHSSFRGGGGFGGGGFGGFGGGGSSFGGGGGHVGGGGRGGHR